MSIDQRTRMMKDVRPLRVEEILDEVIPAATEVHGDLAVRGIQFRELPLRFREAILGGATRSFLRDAPVPVFMMH